MRKKGTICFNGAHEKLKGLRPANYEPYEPPKPESHINHEKMNEWKEIALENAADDEEEKEDIMQFTENLTHISFDQLKESLRLCFDKFKEMFPHLEYRHVMVNEPYYRDENAKRSEKWMGELVNHMELYDLYPHGVGEYWTDSRHAWKVEEDKELKKIIFLVDDAIFSGGNFA
jgi:hypothetical protein